MFCIIVDEWRARTRAIRDWFETRGIRERGCKCCAAIVTNREDQRALRSSLIYRAAVAIYVAGADIPFHEVYGECPRCLGCMVHQPPGEPRPLQPFRGAYR